MPDHPIHDGLVADLDFDPGSAPEDLHLEPWELEKKYPPTLTEMVLALAASEGDAGAGHEDDAGGADEVPLPADDADEDQEHAAA